MLQILLVTFPFFALVLCGYAAARWRMLPLEAIPGLNVFVLLFALPCLLYRFASNTPILRLLDPSLLLTYLVCALAVVGLAIATTRRGPIGWNDASFGALVAAFPNSGFMGIPLLVALLGAPASGPAIVCLAVDMVITSSLCIALSQLASSGEHGARHAAVQGLRGIAMNPLAWSIVLGCMSAATGLRLPAPATRVVDMLAQAASPAALFTIGAVLARSRISSQRSSPTPQRRSDVPLLVFCKLIVHPALVFAAGKLAIAFGAPLDASSLAVLVLVAALPSASNVPMLAERFGADAARVARVILVTTGLAFGTFPAIVTLVR